MSLVLEDVTVRRGVGPVISGVSLEIRPGEITTVVGPNGAGKTSLLEAVSGIVTTVRGHDHARRAGRPQALASQARPRRASATSSRAG